MAPALGAVLVGIGMLLGPDVAAHWVSRDGQITSGVLRAYVRMIQVGIVLAGLAVAMPRGKGRRLVGFTLYLLVLAGFVEMACAMVLKSRLGHWHFSSDDPRNSPFVPHPYRVGVPKPGAISRKNGITVSHTLAGNRGPDMTRSGNAGRRVATVGGSSTYCVGVSDDETWPYYLWQCVSNNWDVINLGVPGYSSVEHVIQSAFLLADLRPERAVFYVGWNDARNYRVADLDPEYANFHGRSQYRALQLPTVVMGTDFATLRIAVQLFQRARWLMKTPDVDLAPRRDDSPAAIRRSLDLYARNIRTIITLCREQGIEPVFVPQVLNETALTGDRSYGWLPFVADKELPGVIREYNDVLIRVTSEEKCVCMTNVLYLQWEAADFVDQGHFSPAGNRKFARALAGQLSSAQIGGMHPPAPRTALDAVAAKAALLDLMRSATSPFEGVDPARFETIELAERGEGKFEWGSFVIDLGRKTYSANVDGGAAFWSYQGTFSADPSGSWKAENLSKQHGSK